MTGSRFATPLFLFALQSLSTGCESRYAKGTLVAGQGLGELRLGVTTPAQAEEIVGGEPRREARPRSGTKGGKRYVQNGATLTWPDLRLELYFRGPVDTTGGPEISSYEQFAASGAGKLFTITVHVAGPKGEREGWKGETDKGVGLLSTKSELVAAHGRPASTMGGTNHFWENGLNVWTQVIEDQGKEPVVNRIVLRDVSDGDTSWIPRGAR